MGHLSEWVIKIIISFVVGIVVFLPIVIAAIWNRKRPPLQTEKGSYVMRESVEPFLLGIFCTIGNFIFVVMFIFILDKYTVCGLLIFMIGVIAGVGISIYALLWRCVVGIDSMTFYSPFLPVKVVKFHEITTVKYAEKRTGGYGGGKKFLTGYRNEKKVFEFDEDMVGFDLLCRQLAMMGKIRCRQSKEDNLEMGRMDPGQPKEFFSMIGVIESSRMKEDFSVTATRRDILSAVFGVVLFGGFFIACLVCRDETIGTFYVIVFALFTLLGLTELIPALLWRITVNYNVIHIRNSYGRTESYDFREITMIKEQKNHIILYAGEKKIVKVSKDYKNFTLLQERLRYEGIEWIREQ